MKKFITLTLGVVLLLIAALCRVVLVLPAQQELYTMQDSVKEIHDQLEALDVDGYTDDALNKELFGVDTSNVLVVEDSIRDILSDVLDSGLNSEYESSIPALYNLFYGSTYLGNSIVLKHVDVVPITGGAYYATISWKDGGASYSGVVLCELSDALSIVEAHFLVQ